MRSRSRTPGAPLMTHHRRALGIGLADGVGDLQAADVVGDADGAEPLQPGVGIGGEAGALLVAGVDDLERALLHMAEEGEHVVAGHAKDVADALFLQPPDQVAADAFRHCLPPPAAAALVITTGGPAA